MKCHFNRIDVYVRKAGKQGSKAHISVYEPDYSHLPLKLIVEGKAILVDTTGIKSLVCDASISLDYLRDHSLIGIQTDSDALIVPMGVREV